MTGTNRDSSLSRFQDFLLVPPIPRSTRTPLFENVGKFNYSSPQSIHPDGMGVSTSPRSRFGYKTLCWGRCRGCTMIRLPFSKHCVDCLVELQVLVWDILLHLPQDYKILRNHRINFLTVLFFFSRFGSLKSFLRF